MKKNFLQIEIEYNGQYRLIPGLLGGFDCFDSIYLSAKCVALSWWKKQLYCQF